MPILWFNLSWMIFNSILAILAVVLGYATLQTRNPFLKLIAGIFWLLFLPNTIYIFTDLIHILYQWGRVAPNERILLLLQYVLLQLVGFVTFILAFRPFEVILRKFKIHKKKQASAVIFFNFLIAFGMVLGRIERLNSWDVIVSFDKAINAIVETLTTPTHLGLLILLGLFCNFFYFLFRDPIYRSSVKLVKNL